MLVRSVLAMAILRTCAGTTLSLSSSDLSSSRASLDNVQLTQDFDVTAPLGSKAKVSLVYDKKDRKEFFKEVKIAGAVDKVSYALSHAFASKKTGLTLSSKVSGVSLKAQADTTDALTSLSATSVVDVTGRKVILAPSYNIPKKLAKVGVSSALGAGTSASMELSASDGTIDVDYELGYETALGDGRTLDVSVRPAEQKGKIDIVDTSFEKGGTWVASIGVVAGQKPSLKLKRTTTF